MHYISGDFKQCTQIWKVAWQNYHIRTLYIKVTQHLSHTYNSTHTYTIIRPALRLKFVNVLT